MKNYLGLFLLLFTFEAYSKNTNAVLHLRAIVPITYQVEFKMDAEGPKASIHSNQKAHLALPRYTITKHKNNYLVSIVHP